MVHHAPGVDQLRQRLAISGGKLRGVDAQRGWSKARGHLLKLSGSVARRRKRRVVMNAVTSKAIICFVMNEQLTDKPAASLVPATTIMGMKTSRLEMIGSAAAGIAHDINNQLNLIVNHLSLADVEGAQRAAIERCVRSDVEPALLLQRQSDRSAFHRSRRIPASFRRPTSAPCGR